MKTEKFEQKNFQILYSKSLKSPQWAFFCDNYAFSIKFSVPCDNMNISLNRKKSWRFCFLHILQAGQVDLDTYDVHHVHKGPSMSFQHCCVQLPMSAVAAAPPNRDIKAATQHESLASRLAVSWQQRRSHWVKKIPSLKQIWRWPSDWFKIKEFNHDSIIYFHAAGVNSSIGVQIDFIISQYSS